MSGQAIAATALTIAALVILILALAAYFAGRVDEATAPLDDEDEAPKQFVARHRWTTHMLSPERGFLTLCHDASSLMRLSLVLDDVDCVVCRDLLAAPSEIGEQA